MKVVSPFRPFVPESSAHLALGPFDWVGALQMLRSSVRHHCACETFAITDVDTALPGPTYRYETQERRLMLWLLEVALCYLRSDDFDDDTMLISPDTLVTADLSRWFRADLGVMVRTAAKYADKPLLNGVQCWRVAAKNRLVAFYAQALEGARQSVPDLIRWGADTSALVDLLTPLQAGHFARAGLSVFGFEAWQVFRPAAPGVITPIVDFKGRRKHAMAMTYAELGLPSCA
jgi:hypothetical protein